MLILLYFCTIIASSGQDHELFLEAPNTLVSLLQDICIALVEPNTKSHQQTANHQFVCQDKNPEIVYLDVFLLFIHMGMGVLVIKIAIRSQWQIILDICNASVVVQTLVDFSRVLNLSLLCIQWR